MEKFDGETKIYNSFDSIDNDDNDEQNLNRYPQEFLNKLIISGVPPHELKLKLNCPIMLLRNLNPYHGAL